MALGNIFGRIRARPVRYSHEAFARRIDESTQDHVPSLVYADWLDEHDMPTFASIIRHHIEHHAQNNRGPHLAVTSIAERSRDRPPYTPVGFTEQAGHTNYLVGVEQVVPRAEGETPHLHYWSHVVGTPHEANALLEGLQREGVRIASPVTRWTAIGGALRPPARTVSPPEPPPTQLSRRLRTRLSRSAAAHRAFVKDKIRDSA